ncbi:MAG: hypothetical protein O3B73_07660 [bacterium]|jgi:hypothetical protein|nr:hypothetical protein [bacterium]
MLIGILQTVSNWVRPGASALGLLLWILTVPAQAAESVPDSARVNIPRRTMLRSLVLPGWGQFHNGKQIKGGVIATIEVGSAAAYWARRAHLRDLGSSERNIYFFSTIGVVLYSMADAYVDAYLDRVDWAEVEIGVGPEGSANFRLKVKLGSDPR